MISDGEIQAMANRIESHGLVVEKWERVHDVFKPDVLTSLRFQVLHLTSQLRWRMELSRLTLEHVRSIHAIIDATLKSMGVIS